jgi:hypothetical protein
MGMYAVLGLRSIACIILLGETLSIQLGQPIFAFFFQVGDHRFKC